MPTEQAEGQPQKQVNQEGKPDNTNSQINFDGLNLSKEAIAQLQANSELLNLMQGTLQKKREANNEAKTYREQLETRDRKEKEADEERLKKKGEYEALYNKAIQERDAEKSRNKEILINSKLEVLATQKGLKKTEYLKLFDASTFEINDKLEVIGLNDKFEDFYKTNPELFGSNDNNNSIDTGKPRITNTYDTNIYKELEKKAATGNEEAIIQWRLYKKKNNIK